MESNVQKRKEKRYKTILKTILDNNNLLSKVDICSITKYSMTAVNESIENLIADNMVFETESSETKVGRKPVIMSINPNSSYFLSIQCSSYSIDIAVINSINELIYKKSSLLNYPSANEMLQRIKDLILEFEQLHKEIWSKVLNICVALPGKLDRQNGIGIKCNSIHDWNNINVKEFISKFTDKKTLFTHNIDALLTGYLHIHDMPKDKTTVCLMIRNGVGIRIHSKGRLLSDFEVVCELEHDQANNSNRICYCGKKGCFATEVTIPATINKIHELVTLDRSKNLNKLLELDDEHLIIREFCNLVIAGDENAAKILDHTSEFICQLINRIILICNPDTIILSTEFCNTDSCFKQHIMNNFDRSNQYIPSIDYITTDNEYGVLGCAITGYLDFLTCY